MTTILLSAFLAVVPRPTHAPVSTVVTQADAVRALAGQVERTVRSGAADIVGVDLGREIFVAAQERK